MTVAAGRRLVHHAGLVEMNAKAFRQARAALNKRAQAKSASEPFTDNQNEGGHED